MIEFILIILLVLNIISLFLLWGSYQVYCEIQKEIKDPKYERLFMDAMESNLFQCCDVREEIRKELMARALIGNVNVTTGEVCVGIDEKTLAPIWKKLEE